jgi:hypothetical protein
VWRIAIIPYAIITFPMAGGGRALPCSKSWSQLCVERIFTMMIIYGPNCIEGMIVLIVTSIILQLLFFVMYGHHILEYFCFLKVYLINLKLNLINFFKNPTNNEKIECMKYICDKILHVT